MRKVHKIFTVLFAALQIGMLCGCGAPAAVQSRAGVAGRTESTAITEYALSVSQAENEYDLFVFSGQSNMMGGVFAEDFAAGYGPWQKTNGKVDTRNTPYICQPISAEETKGSYEYKYLTDTFETVDSQTPTGELVKTADGTALCKPSGTYELNGTTMVAPFVKQYTESGYKSISAQIALGGTQLCDWMTSSEIAEVLLSDEYAFHAQSGAVPQGASPRLLAGNERVLLFERKLQALTDSFTRDFAGCTIASKNFVWLQGENDADALFTAAGLNEEATQSAMLGSMTLYKKCLEVFWKRLQSYGFERFMIVRVGFWTAPNRDIAIMAAQEQFAAENENAYILTRAMSYMPNPKSLYGKWGYNAIEEAYALCRGVSYSIYGNPHLNEKGHILLGTRSANAAAEIVHKSTGYVPESEEVDEIPALMQRYAQTFA